VPGLHVRRARAYPETRAPARESGRSEGTSATAGTAVASGEMARSSYGFAAFLWFLSASGCGGSAQPAPSAPESGEERSPSSASDDASAAADGAGENATSAADSETAPCDDGTCTPCGSALCPSGWYCDESAKGGPACGWLPECAQKPTCGCVKRAFGGCSCEDEGGAAHLTCG
jgi:hypothetical protein